MDYLDGTGASGTGMMVSHVKTHCCVVCFEAAVVSNSYPSLGDSKLKRKARTEKVSDTVRLVVISEERC